MLTRKIDELSLDPNNARKHGDADLETLARSLDTFGQQTPIVIDATDTVVKGNGTLMAAMKLGWAEIQCIQTSLTGEELKAYAIADNQTGLLSEWDEERLAEQLHELQEDPELLEATGFSGQELDDLLELAEEELEIDQEEEIPPPPVNPVTQPGDIWLLGSHRMICGDAMDQETASKLFGDSKADMLLTDPPYGVSYVGKTKDALTIDNDDLSKDDLEQLVEKTFSIAQEYSRPGAYWFATVPAGPLHLIFAKDWVDRGILRQIMVWAKDSMVLGHSEYHYQHEPILFGWIPDGKRHKNKDRTRTTLWQYDRPKASREHPTMKPIALWSQAITDGSRRGEIVFDPFLGSGTSIVASEYLKRKCFGSELDPAYCDVICNRWVSLFGTEPVLQSSGESFSQVAKQRLAK